MSFRPILLDLPTPITTPRLILRPPQIGDGIAVNEAVLESFDVLRQLGMKRIAITCDIDNQRSKKISERLGFILEATLKTNRVKVTGEISDTLVFTRYDLKGLPDLLVTW